LVKDEKFLIDAFHGISGSGRRMSIYFMQSMMEAALQMGFSPNVSLKSWSPKPLRGHRSFLTRSTITQIQWMKK